MEYPFISLVVVNYNGQDIIKHCLHSLLGIKYPKDKYEIIVVDNSSTDNSLSITKKLPRIKIIQNKKNMGYVGINSCLERVKGKYIFILNNDIEMEKNCPKKLVELIEKNNAVGMTVPKLVNFYNRNIESSGTWLSRSFYNGHYVDKNGKQKVKEIPYLGVGMIKTNIARKFGYIYDPDYFIYAEDLDLSLRLRLMGYKTVYVPEAIIYHMHAITTKKSNRGFITFLLEKNLLTTFLKILSIKNIILFLPYVLGMRLIAFSRDIIMFNFGAAFARVKAVLWVASHFNLIYKKRKETQKFRKVKDKFILKVFSEKYLIRAMHILL